MIPQTKQSQQEKAGHGAQSTFEYILTVAAVIVVLVVFLSPQGPFRGAVEKTLNQTVDQINTITNSIDFN